MRNEAFYATTAQVLPTLLIAFVLEIGLYALTLLTQEGVLDKFRAVLRRDADVAHRLGYITGSTAAILGLGVTIAAPVFMALIFIGEAAAVLVLFFGTRGVLAAIGGWVCVVAMVGGTGLILWMPIYRVYVQIRSKVREARCDDRPA